MHNQRDIVMHKRTFRKDARNGLVTLVNSHHRHVCSNPGGRRGRQKLFATMIKKLNNPTSSFVVRRHGTRSVSRGDKRVRQAFGEKYNADQLSVAHNFL
jgi:hypothetical protein